MKHLGRREFLIGLLSTTALVVVQPARAVTSIGAIYATKSKLLQRVYIPSFDDAEIDNQHVHPGETLTRLPLDLYVPGGAAFCQSIIGVPTFSGRCVVVDDNNVIVDAITADPDIYWDARGRVIPSDDGGVGDVWLEPPEV